MSLTDAQRARIEPLLPDRTPRIRLSTVLADEAYSSRAVRGHLRNRGIRAGIPQPADQIANRGWRVLTTRCDKTATIHQAALHLAAIRIWTAR